MDKQNIFFIFTLLVGFFIAFFVGTYIFVPGSLSKINPQLKNKVQDTFYHKLTPSSTSSSLLTPILSFEPTITTIVLSPTAEDVTVFSFARCLAKKRFTMYGTPECPSCALQREYFGDSFSIVPYINCNEKKELCQSKSITAYPTWEDSDGRFYKGAIPLEILADLSGCQAPNS